MEREALHCVDEARCTPDHETSVDPSERKDEHHPVEQCDRRRVLELCLELGDEPNTDVHEREGKNLVLHLWSHTS